MKLGLLALVAVAASVDPDRCGCLKTLNGDPIPLSSSEESAGSVRPYPMGFETWHPSLQSLETSRYFVCLQRCDLTSIAADNFTGDFIAGSSKDALYQSYLHVARASGITEEDLMEESKPVAQHTHSRRGSFGAEAQYSNGKFCISESGTTFTAGLVASVIDYLKEQLNVDTCEDDCGHLFTGIFSKLANSNDKKETLRSFVADLLRCYRSAIIKAITDVVADALDVVGKYVDVVEGGVEAAWDCGKLGWDFFVDGSSGYHLGHEVGDCAIDLLKEAWDVAKAAARRRSAPIGWTCHPSLYNDGVKCQVFCGVTDPDCLKMNLPIARPKSIFDTPSGWDCPSHFYQTNDGCDVNCGVEDPDCADKASSVTEYKWKYTKSTFQHERRKTGTESKLFAPSPSPSPSSSNSKDKGASGGAIAGAVVGAVCVCALVVVAVLTMRSKRQYAAIDNGLESSTLQSNLMSHDKQEM